MYHYAQWLYLPWIPIYKVFVNIESAGNIFNIYALNHKKSEIHILQKSSENVLTDLTLSQYFQ